jgi:putrescine transport system substrate-binding protein
VRKATLAAYVFAAAMLAGCGKQARPIGANGEEMLLNIYSWSNYIAPDTIPNFEKETGIKVHYDTYDTNEVLESKLLTGQTNYDIVIPSGDFFERQVKAGVFRKLDRKALTNIGNLDPDIMRRLDTHDPGNLHAVPYMWSATGLGYDPAQVEARLGKGFVKSWALLLDPGNAAKLKDCGISVLDSPFDVISSVMIYLGRDANSREPRDIQAAIETLMKTRPFVRYIDSAQYVADLANGSLCLSLGWSGDFIQARDRAREAGTGKRIVFFVPEEGGLITIDAMGIPADAPHPLNAQLWMNYLMRPKVMAAITNAVKYPNGNLASVPFVDPAIANDPEIYLDARTRAKLQVHRAQPPDYSRIVMREWTRFKTGE